MPLSQYIYIHIYILRSITHYISSFSFLHLIYSVEYADVPKNKKNANVLLYAAMKGAEGQPYTLDAQTLTSK